VDDENDWLRQARAGSSDALALIFDTYYDSIYRYIYHHVHHVQAAEDLAASVFQRFWEQLTAKSGPDYQLKAWLFRVAYHLIIDDSRRQQHRHHEPLLEDFAIPADDIESRLVEKQLAARAYAGLEQLTPSQRDVITLRYLAEMSPAETASILNLTVGAVKALQHRALDVLRQQMLPYQEQTHHD
jgi:RNA polymerase sigma-70 factor, ECF subfamily